MTKPRVVASVEARMGSSRFPGKMLADVCGVPALGRVFERLKRCELVDDIVLATTDSPKDKPLTELAESMGISFFCGSEENVLDRVVKAGRSKNADVIVEVTGDCILLDYKVIDKGIDFFIKEEVDLVSNGIPQTYPQGVDAVIVSMPTLEDILKSTDDPAHFEHVTLGIYENPDRYKISYFHAPPEMTRPDWRFQLDYKEDLEFIRAVYQRFYETNRYFTAEDAIEYIDKNPDLLKINTHMKEKDVR